VVIRQAPADVDTAELVPLLSEIGEKLAQGGHMESPREQILHSMACKAAIKAGRSNEPAELDRLCQAVLSGRVKYCPHGRPVAVSLTKGKLDKLFGRI